VPIALAHADAVPRIARAIAEVEVADMGEANDGGC
jgi:hypothetical protein